MSIIRTPALIVAACNFSSRFLGSVANIAAYITATMDLGFDISLEVDKCSFWDLSVKTGNQIDALLEATLTPLKENPPS